jgi:hypothetical protein
MDMEQDALRQSLLTELIDKMHSRLADKMFPDSNAIPMPNHDQGDLPAASDIPGTEAAASVDHGADVTEHGDMKGDDHGTDNDESEMSEEELEEMLKGIDK